MLAALFPPLPQLKHPLPTAQLPHTLQKVALLNTLPPTLPHRHRQPLPRLPRHLLRLTLARILGTRGRGRQVDTLLFQWDFWRREGEARVRFQGFALCFSCSAALFFGFRYS